ncbi:MAG: transposase family protein [Bradyrhizobium sp.]
MQQALHRSSLVPRGFVVQSACYEGDKAVITVRASGSVGVCPSCGMVSRRVHSRYQRRATDLPLSGRVVQLLVIARRFRCDAVLCGRQIFTERFAEGVLAQRGCGLPSPTDRCDADRHSLGERPVTFLKARLKAASES